jgi:hypothetical protein
LSDAADAFMHEWIHKRFSKAELAQEIARCLRTLDIHVRQPAADRSTGWQTIASSTTERDDGLDTFFPQPGRA